MKRPFLLACTSILFPLGLSPREKARMGQGIDSVKRCELSAVVKIPSDIEATWPLVFIKGRLAPAIGNSKVLTGKSVSYENTD